LEDDGQFESLVSVWLYGAQPGEARGGALAFVVTDERIDRREVDGGGDVDGVERPEGGLCQRARGREQAVVEREQPERFEQLAGSAYQGLEGEARVTGGCASDRTWQFGEDELTGNQVGTRKEGPQHLAFGLVADQLDEG
jgi:hypothetical protein